MCATKLTRVTSDRARAHARIIPLRLPPALRVPRITFLLYANDLKTVEKVISLPTYLSPKRRVLGGPATYLPRGTWRVLARVC